jgi:hypothetical protein
MDNIIFLRLKGFFLFLARKINLHGIMRKIFYDKWYMRALKLEKTLASKGWIYLGSGKDRRVWKRGNVVLKIGYVESGVISNLSERKLYLQSLGRDQEAKYAPCRLVSDNVLMMRYVKELDDLDPCQAALIPKWAYYLNDGQQVGIDQKGNVLVYDYADEIGGINGNR